MDAAEISQKPMDERSSNEKSMDNLSNSLGQLNIEGNSQSSSSSDPEQQNKFANALNLLAVQPCSTPTPECMLNSMTKTCSINPSEAPSTTPYEKENLFQNPNDQESNENSKASTDIGNKPNNNSVIGEQTSPYKKDKQIHVVIEETCIIETVKCGHPDSASNSGSSVAFENDKHSNVNGSNRSTNSICQNSQSIGSTNNESNNMMLLKEGANDKGTYLPSTKASVKSSDGVGSIQIQKNIHNPEDMELCFNSQVWNLLKTMKALKLIPNKDAETECGNSCHRMIMKYIIAALRVEEDIEENKKKTEVNAILSEFFNRLTTYLQKEEISSTGSTNALISHQGRLDTEAHFENEHKINEKPANQSAELANRDLLQAEERTEGFSSKRFYKVEKGTECNEELGNKTVNNASLCSVETQTDKCITSGNEHIEFELKIHEQPQTLPSSSSNYRQPTELPKSDRMENDTCSAEPQADENMPSADQLKASKYLSIEKVMPIVTLGGDCKNFRDEKVMLLLGASGSGKTTMVKLIASIVSGIESPNAYLSPKNKKKMETLVKQQGMIAYRFKSDLEDNLAITVIDTAGMNDTSGKEIKHHLKALESFLEAASTGMIDIHVIGFVMQAHVSRLTASEELVVEYVTRHFEKSSGHILPLITFSDNQKVPPAIKALQENKLNVEKYFLFNNSILSQDDINGVTDIDKGFWKIGLKNWKKISKIISQSPALPIKTLKDTIISVTIKEESNVSYNGAEKNDGTSLDNTVPQTTNNSETKYELFKKTVIQFHKALYGRQHEAYSLRQEIWNIASDLYYSEAVSTSLDEWLYHNVYQILVGDLLPNFEMCLSVLALSKNRPLYFAAVQVINLTKNLFNEFYNHRGVFNKLTKKTSIPCDTVIYQTFASIDQLLLQYNASHFMTRKDFLSSLWYEVTQELAEYIGVLLEYEDH